MLRDDFRPSPAQKRLFRIVLVVMVIYILIQTIFQIAESRNVSKLGLPSPMDTFTSEETHISIDYPQRWSATNWPDGDHGDPEPIAYITGPGDIQLHIFVYRRQEPSNDLAEVVAWGEMKYQDWVSGDYEVSSPISLNTDNFEGMSREYLYSYKPPIFPEQFVRCIYWSTLDGMTGYTLAFCASEANWAEAEPVFYEMIESFKITS